MLAQAEVFARGRRIEDVPGATADPSLAAQKVHAGNHPSTLILLKDVSPRSLGALIALYEHKVYVQSVIWGINPFDQWGVELGKAMVDSMLPLLERPIAAAIGPGAIGTLHRLRSAASRE